MKNIRQILIAASAGVSLMAMPHVFGDSPRQTPDPFIPVPQSFTSDMDLTTTIADLPGSPRMKADPSLAGANSAYAPQCDSVPQIESMPGSPRQKLDPSDLIQSMP